MSTFPPPGLGYLTMSLCVRRLVAPSPRSATPVRAIRHRAGALAALLLVGGCSTTAAVHSRGVHPVETAGVATTPEGTTAETTPYESSASDSERPPVASLAWHDCGEEVEDDSMQCTKLTVPLDYDEPRAATVDLALIKMPASGRRKGAVLFNPGGPGLSGVEPIAVSGATLAWELGLERFDLIGFDPRGVERSGGLRCLDDASMDRVLYLDQTPDDAAERALLDEADAAFTDACKRKYGDTLGLYSTENTARDMDRIREALGDEEVSFIGISYGTYLGATYATLFPDRVRAMVLDSAFEPGEQGGGHGAAMDSTGFGQAFDHWVEWCQALDDCAFHADDVGARWEALLQELEDHPVAASDGRTVNEAVMDTATAAALYARSDWPVLAAALANAEAGNGATLLRLADEYNGRHADGTFDTLNQSFTVIACASGVDLSESPDPGSLCPALTGSIKPVKPHYDGEAPVVVIGGTNDPATPIELAEEMVSDFGPSAVLVTFTGEGHGQLLVSTCVTDIEATVLTELRLPAEGTTCEADPPVQRPEWWDSIPVPEGISYVVGLPELVAAVGPSETQAYSETRTTPMPAVEAAQMYHDTLAKLGFQRIEQPYLGLPDSSASMYLTTSDEVLWVIVLGPRALADDELAAAASAVRPGQSVILLMHVPD